MRLSMFFVVVAAALTLACGKEGPQGPAGPAGAQGPAGPTNRVPSYCNGVNTSATAANSWTLSASCSAAVDIPVEGWCYEPAGLPSGAFLANSAPVNWENMSVAAGWTCTWGWQNGATTSPIPAIVEMCCATPQ